MPMRHAVLACRHVTGQLRLVTHECVGYAGIRIIRMPAFFLSAEVNPDYYYNDNDDPNVHRPSPPCSLVGANDATALCRQHA